MSCSYKSNLENVIKRITNAEKLALEEIGFFVEAEAKSRTTVDKGTLKRSITNVVDEKEKSVIIGTNVEYAPYVELGTSTQSAKPYLTPAIKENEEKINEILQKHLLKEVK
ncbi:MAG: hypothetical protein K0S41_3673 [Anaerocolumna sp.]|jgi:HK97 gp10 family phage protein|nr:hypothetical protein [Anaerocolumna sp.]